MHNRLWWNLVAGGIGLAACLGTTTVQAEEPFSPHGYEDVWSCNLNAQGFDWSSSSMYSEQTIWFRTRDLPGGTSDRWWTYASPGGSSLDCGQYVTGWLAGGGTWNGSGPSVSKGVDVSVQMFHDDWGMDYTDEGDCFHTHLTEYVIAWYWQGSYWIPVDYDSFQLQGNMENGHCRYRGENLGGPPGYLVWGDGDEDQAIRINNSPYLVLWTMHQAPSHFSHGCGEFQCYHHLYAISFYL